MVKRIERMLAACRRRSDLRRTQRPRVPLSFESLESRTVLSASNAVAPPAHDAGSLAAHYGAPADEIVRQDAMRPQYDVVRIVAITNSNSTLRTLLQMFAPTAHRESFNTRPASTAPNGLRLQDAVTRAWPANGVALPKQPGFAEDRLPSLGQDPTLERPPLRAQAGPASPGLAVGGILGAVPTTTGRQDLASLHTFSKRQVTQSRSVTSNESDSVVDHELFAALSSYARDAVFQTDALWQSVLNDPLQTPFDSLFGAQAFEPSSAAHDDVLEFVRLRDLSLHGKSDGWAERLASDCATVDDAVQAVAELRSEWSRTATSRNLSRDAYGSLVFEGTMADGREKSKLDETATNELLRPGMILLPSVGNEYAGERQLAAVDDSARSILITSAIEPTMIMHQAFDIDVGDVPVSAPNHWDGKRILNSSRAASDERTDDGSRLSKNQAASIVVSVAAGAILWRERKNRASNSPAEQHAGKPR